MIERRGVPRWAIGSPVAVHLKDEGVSGVCICEDMNLRGMRVSFRYRLPDNPSHHLWLSLMNGFYMDVTVHVRWSAEIAGRFVYGFEFDDIRDSDRDGLYYYLREKAGSAWEEHWWMARS